MQMSKSPIISGYDLVGSAMIGRLKCMNHVVTPYGMSLDNSISPNKKSKKDTSDF